MIFFDRLERTGSTTIVNHLKFFLTVKGVGGNGLTDGLVEDLEEEGVQLVHGNNGVLKPTLGYKRDVDICFTFLRHPVEQVVALFHFMNNHFTITVDEDIKRKSPGYHHNARVVKALLKLNNADRIQFLEELLQRKKYSSDFGTFVNQIIEDRRMYFRTSEEIAEYDFVGITEKMDESLQCLSGLLGILYKKPRVWYNCTFGSVEPYTEYIPVLEENLKEYIDAYNEAKGALR